MKPDQFEEPVWIYVGVNVPRPVASPTQAFVFLDNCPAGLRGPAHGRALEACRSAMNGRAGTESARAALIAFAEARGILAPDFTPAFAAHGASAPAARPFA
ncbi:hypothetical protein GCM10011390_41400 [Aureimonas endophytica]|uniref:DUF982 domain-containing protein n=1 Tax=Aureimonas endophytica TaxID=2027858 RepID=A0A916ZXH9_9HYPH|nr:DUF982 domain-containing protein [Aureimonas endophytica]GGE17930.1 hypothetical protein GCM10011390_41400 [Aureimonas endophytica]